MENIQEKIGERIAAARKQVRLSQSDLALKLDKSLRTIQKYESGEIDMPISVLQQISAILGVSMNDLIGYQPAHVQVNTLSDALAFLFELDRKKEIHYEIKMTRGELKDWKCYLEFFGNDPEAIYNATLCQAMQTLKRNREALDTYWMDYDTYDAWETERLSRYTDCLLTDKERVEISNDELLRRRAEGEFQRYQQLIAEAEAKKDSKE